VAVTFTGGTASALFFGNDATTQNIFAIQNGIASRVNMIVRAIDVEVDNLVALAAVMPLVKVSRATSISGGVTLPAERFLTTQTPDPAIVFRAPTWEGAPITATPGTTLWQIMYTRSHTVVEQILGPAGIAAMDALPEIATTKDVVLRPGESLLVQIVAAAGTSNAALANTGNVSCEWEEDAIATFAISGTVTLSGSPVSGAIVTVIEADDTSMTNAVLRETIVTPAGGTWSSDIRTGKVAAAFVQYETGGTMYTAPGSPYLESP
jgi:hypothetical protein